MKWRAFVSTVVNLRVTRGHLPESQQFCYTTAKIKMLSRYRHAGDKRERNIAPTHS
jgi:hypothetical protein